VLAVRLADRVGKGVRTAPRDAMLAASVSEEQRGAAFGLHRSMDHAGATLGPLLAFVLLTTWTTDVRDIFAVAVVPGLLAALVVWGSREERPVETAPAVPPVSGPEPQLWRVLLPIGLATLGTASDTFLMLKAGVDERAPITALPLLWMALHLVRTASAAPGGWLADRIGARGIITVGWSIRGLVFLLLALAPDLSWTAAAVVLYGLAGAADGAEKQLVAKFAPKDARGAAFGSFHAVVGAVALPASLGFGWLWDTFGVSTAFGTSSVLVLSAIVLLWSLLPGHR
jgi:MFS family permease